MGELYDEEKENSVLSSNRCTPRWIQTAGWKHFQKKMSVMKSSGMLPVGFFSACGSEERGSLA